MGEELRAAPTDDREPMETARRWKAGEMVRIGIEDVTGLADIEQTHAEMTGLAEACLRFALERVQQERGLTRTSVRGDRHGEIWRDGIGVRRRPHVLFVGGTDTGDQADAVKFGV